MIWWLGFACRLSSFFSSCSIFSALKLVFSPLPSPLENQDFQGYCLCHELKKIKLGCQSLLFPEKFNSLFSPPPWPHSHSQPILCLRKAEMPPSPPIPDSPSYLWALVFLCLYWESHCPLHSTCLHSPSSLDYPTHQPGRSLPCFCQGSQLLAWTPFPR